MTATYELSDDADLVCIRCDRPLPTAEASVRGARTAHAKTGATT